MPLRAVTQRSLADQVFDQLAGEIMAERYAPGVALPPERTLALVFHVNRHVVREALKRLEQLGLVHVSRGGAKVTDFKRRAGLDLLAMMAEHAPAGDEAGKFFLSVLEMRALIGADVVRLCALRAKKEVREALVAIARDMRAAATDEALFALEVRFWEVMLDGADNIAYRLAFNSLLKGAYAMGPMAREWSMMEIRSNDYRKPLASAIAAGDAATAEAMTRKIMGAAVDALAGGTLSFPAAAAPPRTGAKKPARARGQAGQASRRR
jgi:GntR family transcriptional repressor for pyruvate dehydrogenase complex